MSDDKLKPAFARAGDGKAENRSATIRDRDNAMPRVKPPELVRTPPPTLAPPGMVGIRRPLLRPGYGPPPEPLTKQPASPDKAPDLTRSFNDLTPTKSKGWDMER